jgi:cytidine deaminase
MAEKESCRVVYFEHPEGIESGCAKCRQILRDGSWAVGLIVSEKHKYFVGVNPPVMCCGEEKKVIETYHTEDEAKALMARVIEQLNRDGTTKNLKLYEVHPVVSTAVN